MVAGRCSWPPGRTWGAGPPRDGGERAQLPLCLRSSGPVCAAAGRPARPGEPNQCWTWRWSPNALWGTSNGSSRWVSVGAPPGPLLAGPYFPPRPSRLWPLTPHCPALAAPRLFRPSGFWGSGHSAPAPTGRARRSACQRGPDALASGLDRACPRAGTVVIIASDTPQTLPAAASFSLVGLLGG